MSDEEDTTPVAQPNKTKTCAIRVSILLALIGIIVFVIVDTVTKGCTLIETNAERVQRLHAAGVVNTTLPSGSPVCNGPKSPKAFSLVNGACQQPASCIAVNLTEFLRWIQGATALGPIVMALVYIAATVLFIPGSILTLGAGAAFSLAWGLGVGVLVATISVWVGASIGACLAFLLGRYLFREWVAEQVKKFKVLVAIDRAIEGNGLKMVTLLRLSPVIPFNAFNYVMGSTAVKFREYAIGCVGMIPGTAGFCFIGGAVATATSAATSGGGGSDSIVKTVILVVGLVATVAAVAVVTVTARKELKKYLDLGEEPGAAVAAAEEGGLVAGEREEEEEEARLPSAEL